MLNTGTNLTLLCKVLHRLGESSVICIFCETNGMAECLSLKSKLYQVDNIFPWVAICFLVGLACTKKGNDCWFLSMNYKALQMIMKHRKFIWSVTLLQNMLLYPSISFSLFGLSQNIPCCRILIHFLGWHEKMTHGQPKTCIMCYAVKQSIVMKL